MNKKIIKKGDTIKTTTGYIEILYIYDKNRVLVNEYEIANDDYILTGDHLILTLSDITRRIDGNTRLSIEY
jgi:hypothetical protein